MTNLALKLRPANSLVRIEDDGKPWICGYRCRKCSAVAAAPTMACRRCASRDAPEPFAASATGKLHTWSVVERSYPGVKTPFVSAIVDLEDGLTLKGTLIAAPDITLRAGMPVVVMFDDAGGVVDKDGGQYVGYHFAPAIAGERK
jgi:uncharacterized protein